jgi:uncharacterized protein (UPF0335 family)
MTDSIPADELVQSYFRRWSEIEDRKAECADDAKELAAEAKGNGLNVKAMRAAFQRVRKLEADRPAVEEHEAEVELYLDALARVPSRAQARDAREARGRRRLSESMADTKELSAEMVDMGVITAEKHAETVRIANGVAAKRGAG